MIDGVTILEIILAGGLPHLSGLPHLPGVPHLHVNRLLLRIIGHFRAPPGLCFKNEGRYMYGSSLLDSSSSIVTVPHIFWSISWSNK